MRDEPHHTTPQVGAFIAHRSSFIARLDAIRELVRNGVSLALSLPIRVFPRRRRFRAVLAAGRALTPLAGSYVTRRFGRRVWGSPTDETLRILFKGLARMRVAYEPELDLEIPDEVLAALGKGGAVFVTVHFPLNPLFTRWLYDQGHPPVIIRETLLPSFVWGTATELELLRPSHNVMLQIRRKLEEGAPVLLAIDRARAESRPFPVETRFGPTEIATSIFTLAQRMDVPVFFFGVRATAGLPAAEVRQIEPEPQAFAEHFQRYAGQMLP
ncbi:MAG TPA: hypothetical protein VEK57_08230 [Thermoanaerobaculia bacterium]|nr:hypothetical protein [Thermoanaerobaculia bacterium]